MQAEALPNMTCNEAVIKAPGIDWAGRVDNSAILECEGKRAVCASVDLFLL